MPKRAVSWAERDCNTCFPYWALSSPRNSSSKIYCPIRYLVYTSARLTDVAIRARLSSMSRAILRNKSSVLVLLSKLMYTKIGYQDFNNQRFRNIFVRSNEILCFPSFFIGASDPRRVNRQNKVRSSALPFGVAPLRHARRPHSGQPLRCDCPLFVSSRTISSPPPRRTLKKNRPIDEK